MTDHEVADFVPRSKDGFPCLNKHVRPGGLQSANDLHFYFTIL